MHILTENTAVNVQTMAAILCCLAPEQRVYVFLLEKTKAIGLWVYCLFMHILQLSLSDMNEMQVLHKPVTIRPKPMYVELYAPFTV